MAGPTNKLVTSLDLHPDELGQFTEALQLDLKRLHISLGDPNHIDKNQLTTAIGKIINHIPGGLKKDLEGSREALKSDLAQVLTDYALRIRDQRIKVPKDEDIEMLIHGIIFTLMQHQSSFLANSRGLDTEAILKGDYQKFIKGGHLSIIGQRVATLLTYAASFYTSNEFLREHLGKYGTKYGIKEAMIKPLQMWAAPTVSAIFSQLVRVIKDEAEKIALHEKVSGIRGFFRAVVRPFGKKKDSTDGAVDVTAGTSDLTAREIAKAHHRMGVFALSGASAFVAGKLLVVILDAFSNLTGYATTQLKTDVVSEAVEKGKGDIGARIDTIREQIHGMHADETVPVDLTSAPTDSDSAPVMFGKLAHKDVQEELLGNSVTAAAGPGSMYHAKQYMYSGNPESRAYLTMTAEEIIADAKAHDRVVPSPERAAELVTLRTEFLKAIDGAGVADNPLDIAGEVSETMEAKFTEVHKILDSIVEMEKDLNPETHVEDLKKQFDAMTDKIDQVVKIINDIPKGVNVGVAKRYTELSQRLVEIALSHPKIYKEAKRTTLKPWTFKGFTIDNTKVCIPKPPYIDETNLVEYMRKNWGSDVPGAKEKSLISYQVALRFLQYLAISILISYGDLILFLWFSRKAYEKDTTEAKKIREEWIKNYREKIADILTRQLNSGMFGAAFHNPDVEIAQATVEKALADRVAELTRKNLTGWGGRESKSMKVVSRVLPVASLVDYGGFTEAAQYHNAEVRAYQQILASPEEMGHLLQMLLPGLELVGNPQPGQTMGDVLAMNNSRGIERRDTLQIDTINGARRRIGSVRSGTSESSNAVEWEKQWEILNGQEGLLNGMASKVTDANRGSYDEVVLELHQTQRQLEGILAHIVERENLTQDFHSTDSDADLLAHKARLERFQMLLQKLDVSKNIDFAATVSSALRGITGALRGIDAARAEKAGDAQVAHRRDAMKDAMADAEADVLKIAQWLKKDKPDAKPRDRAESVATLLGQKLAVYSLRPNQKIDADTTQRLKARYQTMIGHLELVAHDNDARKDEIRGLTEYFTRGMEVLELYFLEDEDNGEDKNLPSPPSSPKIPDFKF